MKFLWFLLSVRNEEKTTTEQSFTFQTESQIVQRNKTDFTVLLN
jgi:hypothetical protein